MVLKRKVTTKPTPKKKTRDVLDKAEELSRRGRGSRNKGSSYERSIAKVLNSRFPKLELTRTPQSGGFQKSSQNRKLRGDLSNLNDKYEFKLHIECKNQKTISVKKWMCQATSDCPEGRIPTVIMHIGQENKDGKRICEADDFVVMRLADFLTIVDSNAVVKEAE